MRPALFCTLTACALFALSTPLPTAAQAPTKPAAKPRAKAPAKPVAKPVAKAPAVELPLAVADSEQLAAAAMTHLGDYACEFNQTVTVGLNPKNDGYVDVRNKIQTYTMKPVLSSTGALRLEDVKGQMLMLQIANKSMLMDVKLGQRIVDDCVHEKQRAYMLALQAAQAAALAAEQAASSAAQAASAAVQAAAAAATAASAADAASAPR